MAPAAKRRPKAQSSAASNGDGGALSLLGYLYQLLGSASVRVSLDNRRRGSASSDDFVFEVETFGQDAVVTAGRTVQLIQFKYSESGRQISPGEFAKVLITFERSQRGIDTSTKSVRWRLKTNRSLSVGTRAISQGTEPPDKVRIPRSHVRSIRRLIGSHFDFEPSTLSQYQDVLRERARLLGVDDSRTATDRVIALLLRTATNPPELRRIDMQVLDDALAGYSGAQLLSAGDCAPRLRQQLVALAREQAGIAIDDAISRPDVDTLLYSDEAALVLVTGHGGSGKTLSLLKALHDSLDHRDIMVGALMPPPSPSSQSLPQLVASWQCSTPRPVESLDDALRRVILANRHLPRPVLVVCLDGLDESRWQERSDAEALLLRFHELHQRSVPSEALLIVTCRTREQFDALVAPQGAGGTTPRKVPEVALGDFTTEEFQTLWRRWFPDEDVPEVDPAADRYATLDSAMTRRESARVASALCHPVLLGCVRSWKPEERAQLLAGDQRQWQELVRLYVQWFETKVWRRRQCGASTVRAILRAAAIATRAEPSRTTFDLQIHWIAPAFADTHEAPLRLKAVFEDAVTAGLVINGEDRFEMPTYGPVTWQWRFPLVWEHFRSLV